MSTTFELSKKINELATELGKARVENAEWRLQLQHWIERQPSDLLEKSKELLERINEGN